MDSSSDSEPCTSKKAFRCTVAGCNASFSKNRQLISHTRIHTGERPFICDEPGCDKTYTNSSHLIRHKKVSHTAKTIQSVICEYEGCGLELANKYSLKKHYSRKHNPELYPFKCSECSQGFHRKKQLQQHAYLHTGEAPFSCDKCDQSFTTSYNLNKHKRSHRDYSCDCGEIFHRWSLLLAHRKLCRGKEYICNVCDKTFSHAANLKNHNFVHKEISKKSVFQCPYSACKRFYFYKRNLKYHIDNFHKKVNQNQTFKCTYPKCPTVLRTKRSLKMHMQRHFKWIPKRNRKERCDKGKPKKPMISVLLGKEATTKHKGNEDGNILEQESGPIPVDEAMTDESLLQRCELTVKLLNDKMLMTS